MSPRPDRVGGREQAEIGVAGGSPGSGRAGSACPRSPARAGSRTSRPGRPASYSSNTSAVGVCSAQGSRPSRNSVTCWPSRSTIASRPTRSMRLICASRLMRMHRPVQPRRDLLDMGRLAGAVIALDHHPAVVARSRRRSPAWCPDRTHRPGSRSGTRSSASEKAGHLHVAVDAEQLAHLHHPVGRVHHRSRRGCRGCTLGCLP